MPQTSLKNMQCGTLRDIASHSLGSWSLEEATLSAENGSKPFNDGTEP